MHNNVDGGPVYGWAVVLSLHRLKFLEKVLDIHRAYCLPVWLLQGFIHSPPACLTS